MIKFSWKKINNKFDWNGYSVLEYFFLMQNIKIPKYLHRDIPKRVKRYAQYPYAPGPCFIINPSILLQKAVAPNELYFYLEIASKRNVFDYMIRGVKHLPLVMVEEYQKEWIELNPMMTIKDDNVLFMYEQEKTVYGY